MPTTRWRTRDISVYTRLPDVPDEHRGNAHQVIARKMRCFGQLSVHPKDIVEVVVKDKDDPSTWEVVFGFPSKLKRWSITHWPTGLIFSNGLQGRGYIRKANALKVVEQIEYAFGYVLRSLPSAAPADVLVDALMQHPRYDDLVEFKHSLEDKYGVDHVVRF
jgi:hypothetical protein